MTSINDRVVSLWEAWRKTRDSGTLAELMKEMEPQINGAVYKYLHSGLPEAAVRAEAKRLVLDALERYDPTKGTLKNYVAVYLQKLYRYVNNYQNVVRMPENHRIAYGELLRAEDEFRIMTGREPTIAEMADKLGWDPARISLLKKETAGAAVVSSEVWDVHNTSDVMEFNNAIAYAQTKLNPQEMKVLEYSTGIGGVRKGTGEIATELDKSPSWVSTTKNKIVGLLREYLEASGV